MQVIDFIPAHIEAAQQLARTNYEEGRGYVPSLPPVESLPDLSLYADIGLGVAAFEGDTLIGFMCSVPPFRNAFGSTNARGVYSPMGSNGAVGENRAKIYARLYQAAGEKWVHAGASSHAICLYAHEDEAAQQLFRYGFGLRCVDAIRGMDQIALPTCQGYSFDELAPADILSILPLEKMLDNSFISSPFFMYRKQNSKKTFLEEYARFRSIYFAASHQGRIVAFIRAELDGETFISAAPGYLHIKGAYCLPEHRGKGISQRLLGMMTEKLRAEGYTRLGVDFESLNPTAYGFWLKYFDAYARSVVRRIDEKCVKRRLRHPAGKTACQAE